MTLNTINTKAEHFNHGFWSTGTGPEVVVILGSCRVVPYAQYFEYLNASNRFTVALIDVVNFYYDAQGFQVDPVPVVLRFENDPVLLDTLKRCKWFLHEHTANFGIFNTDLVESKNIYQFGINPAVDIMIPNFNDLFILFQDLVNFDSAIRAQAKSDCETLGGLHTETQQFIKARGLADIEKFLSICDKSSLPEFGTLFNETWRKVRYWQTCNHISNAFTIAIFGMICDKLDIHPTPGFWADVAREDMYANPHTPVTTYDRNVYGIEWNEPTEVLKT